MLECEQSLVSKTNSKKKKRRVSGARSFHSPYISSGIYRNWNKKEEDKRVNGRLVDFGATLDVRQECVRACARARERLQSVEKNYLI